MLSSESKARTVQAIEIEDLTSYVLDMEIHQNAQNARPHRNMSITTERQFSSTVLLTKLLLEWKVCITTVLKIVCGNFDAVLHFSM